MNVQTKVFDLLLGGKAYTVKATPYLLNTETRYRVSFNGSPVYVFKWDDEHTHLTVAEKANAVEALPPNLETAIAMRLQQAA